LFCDPKFAHWLQDCTKCDAAEKERLLSNPRARRLAHDRHAAASAGSADSKPSPGTGAKAKQCVQSESNTTSDGVATINPKVQAHYLLDNGASVTAISQANFYQLWTITSVNLRPCEPVQFEIADGTQVEATRIVLLDFELQTVSGSVNLRHVKCYVIPGASREILIGRPEQKTLGLPDMATALADIAARCKDGTAPPERLPVAAPTAVDEASRQLKRVTIIHLVDVECSTVEVDSDDSDAEMESASGGLPTGKPNMERTEAEVCAMLERARLNGASEEFMVALTSVVYKYKDVWRADLGHDPPADVEPMRIELIDPSVVPKAYKARRSAPFQCEFLDEHVEMLVDQDLARPSNSDCSSVIVLVRKPDGTWCMCVDLRFLNIHTRLMRSPLPRLEELLMHLDGPCYFACMDLLKGFWQFPAHPDDTKFLAFVTHRGLYKFTRVVMGAKNSAPHFQKVMTQLLQRLLFICVFLYLDDLLLYGKSERGLMDAIERTLAVLAARKIKAKPSKCDLFCRQLVWCGRLISAEGVKNNPAFVQGLLEMQEMQRPQTAAELRQFLSAANWMRQYVPQYAEVVSPLQNIY
jgi:hypothetical protein